MESREKINKHWLIGSVLLLLLIAILWLFFGWNFKASSIPFMPGIELSPNTKTSSVKYIPNIYFETDNDVYLVNEAFGGGMLTDYKKINLFLSTEVVDDDPIKVRFIKSKIITSNGTDKETIHEGQLGQEFVVFPGRQITADIANLNPTYVQELQAINETERVKIYIETLILVENINTSESHEELVTLECKNMGYVDFVYPDATVNDYYPSCLVTNITKN